MSGLRVLGRERRTAEHRLRLLSDQHGRALLAWCLRLSGGDRQRAEDLVQETLLRAWRSPDVVEDEEHDVRPWLFAVARNLAIDAHRRRRSRPQETGDAALVLLPADDELERSLERWLVADALASLSPAHREVLVETFLRDRSVSEAARVLSVPPGTVKSRTHYALQALRLALQERGVDA